MPNQVVVNKTDTFEIQRQKINTLGAQIATGVDNTIYVSKSGDDANSGLNLLNAKLTIESALSIATTGTMIKVFPGVYTENNPLIVPEQVSIVGTSLREVSVTPANAGDLFYVKNGCYISDMSFVGSSNTGAIVSFNPSEPPYIDQSPYIQNCTNFIPDSIGLRVNGDDAIGPLRSMVVDSYTQYNAGGIGASVSNDAYAQLVSMFTICTDKAIECSNGGGCDLTNSNSSFGNYGLVANGVSDLKYTGSVTTAAAAESDVVRIDISTPTINVQTATFDEQTGLATITTVGNHNFTAGMDIRIEGLTFECTDNGVTSQQVFPSGNFGYVFTVRSTPTSSQFTAYVGTTEGTKSIVHNYITGGTVKKENMRPYDGQVAYFDTLYYEVSRIEITNGGSGYLTPPNVTIDPQSQPWGIHAEGIAEISNSGVVTGIVLVSNGRGYSSSVPNVIIDPPPSGVTATATAVLTPSYFSVTKSEEISTDVYDVTFNNNVPYALSVSDTAYFYKQSRLLASSHSFQYIGSGTDIAVAVPQNGGVTIPENEIQNSNGGLVVFTSTDQSGNFKIGDGVVIDQATGTISGQSYTQSLFATVTPYILALGG